MSWDNQRVLLHDLINNQDILQGPADVDAVVDAVLEGIRHQEAPADVWESTMACLPGRIDRASGLVTQKPDWRLRTQQIRFHYRGLYADGKLTKGQFAEKILISLTNRRTTTYSEVGGHFEVLCGVRRIDDRVRSRRVANPEFEGAMREFERGNVSDAGSKPQRTKREKEQERSLLICVVWYDAAKDCEIDPMLVWNPTGGPVSDYIRTGHMPLAFKREREEALQIMAEVRNPARRLETMDPDVRRLLLKLKGKVSSIEAAEAAEVSKDVVHRLWGITREDEEQIDRVFGPEPTAPAAPAKRKPGRPKKEAVTVTPPVLTPEALVDAAAAKAKADLGL